MSLPDLEVKLGLGNGTISRWRTGSPNSDKLTKVADFFDVSIDSLLGRESESSEHDMDIRKIERARRNMPEKDKERMMKILKASFDEYFNDDYKDDDTNE
jgi:transcriptional regulator with XRE-family HTH domain